MTKKADLTALFGSISDVSRDIQLSNGVSITLSPVRIANPSL